MKRNIYLFLLILSSFLLFSCGTIMHGSSQEVAISSNPSDAQVTIDGNVIGNTPLTKSLSRKDKHSVKIDLEGYHTYETTILRKTSGWVWGNIVFGGLIGLAVDAISGGIYKLSPEQMQAELREGGTVAKVSDNGDNLMIVVTLTPKEQWAKIGQMEKFQ